jgi:AraC-like DNA-binding protein
MQPTRQPDLQGRPTGRRLSASPGLILHFYDTLSAAAGPVPAANPAAATIETLRLDTASLDSNDAFELLSDFSRGVFQLSPLARELETRRQRPQVTWWQLGSLLAGQFDLPSAHFNRTKSEICTGASELVGLRVYETGSSVALFDGEVIRVKAGEALLFDCGRPLVGTETPTRRRSVTIPYAALGYDPTRHPSCVKIDLQSGQGRLLMAALDVMFAELPTVSPDDAGALAAGFTGLLRGLLSWNKIDDIARMSVEEHRAAALRRFLDQHYREPELDADRLAKAVGASRSTVYRVFAAEGGVKRAIARRRLRAAVMELGTSAPRRGAVTKIAEAWGFTDTSWFTRFCRREIGYAPSEIVGLALGSAEPDDGPAPAATELRRRFD